MLYILQIIDLYLFNGEIETNANDKQYFKFVVHNNFYFCRI